MAYNHAGGDNDNGQAAAAERRFVRALELEEPSMLPASGTAAGAEGAVAAELRSGNLKTNPFGGVFPGAHVASPPLEHGEPSSAVAAAEEEPFAQAALPDFRADYADVGSAAAAAVEEQQQQQVQLPLLGLYPSVYSHFPADYTDIGSAAAAAAAAAEEQLPLLGLDPSIYSRFGADYADVGSSAATAAAEEQEPFTKATLPLESLDTAAATAEVEEWFAQQAPLLGDYDSVGYATAAVESSFVGPHSAPLLEHGERSVFPPAFYPHAETQLPAAESSVAHAHDVLPEHGDPSSRAFTTNAEAEGEVAAAVRMDGIGSCPAGTSFPRPTPLLFQRHDRVEAYDGENEDLDQIHTLLLPAEQPLPLLQVHGYADARAARHIVQVEQLGPDDLQHCLRQGESDRALDILMLMVQGGKAINGAVDIEADGRDIIRAHPELVILLRGHGYFSIRMQGDTRRSESYFRRNISGVYPDGVSTGNSYADTLLAQLQATARTGVPSSDDHDFGDANETRRCVNDYLKVYFPEFRNEVERGRTRLGLFGEKEGIWVRCLACHKEYKGYSLSKLLPHQLRDPRGRQALCQASTAYIRQQILEAETDGSGHGARDG